MSRFDYRGDRVKKAFEKLGYSDNGGTGHQKMKKVDDPSKMVVFPRSGEVKTTLLRRILRENGISMKEFEAVYK
ncbi:MAG: type II toxin-antitoxin system HicA family toxin [Candidatus Nanoarchaeia archaeon]|nr:type II toxin-antitoxin system HicA family toxin [Candidatus Nanoarchaeia archaeon]